jgi:hypothetical protein
MRGRRKKQAAKVKHALGITTPAYQQGYIQDDAEKWQNQHYESKKQNPVRSNFFLS